MLPKEKDTAVTRQSSERPRSQEDPEAGKRLPRGVVERRDNAQ